MRQNRIMMCVAVVALAMAGKAMAVPTVGFDLVVTNVSAGSATLDVVVNYGADPVGAGLVFLQMDIRGSSDNLTNNGTNFSRFSFVPGPALANWNPLDPLNPDFSELISVVTYDTFDPGAALLQGTQSIGTLTVNLAGLAGQLVAIGLILPDGQILGGTDAGQENPPLTTQTFELILGDQLGTLTIDTERFEVPQGQQVDVPEPATAALGLMGLAGLARRRRRQA